MGRQQPRNSYTRKPVGQIVRPFRNDFGLPGGTSLVNPSTGVIEGLFADAWRVGDSSKLASLSNETFQQRANDAGQDHAAAISVHDWHLI